MKGGQGGCCLSVYVNLKMGDLFGFDIMIFNKYLEKSFVNVILYKMFGVVKR
jgi:hypothetical protein